MFKFTLMSDLHLDIGSQLRVPIEETEDTVVVAGDTSNGLQCLQYYAKMRRKGKTVIAVEGNHEHYANHSKNRTVDETEESFREHNPQITEVDGVPFVAACGWYTVYDNFYWQNYMNDHKYCVITDIDVNDRAKDHAFFIENELKRWRLQGRRGVVVTHMAPCTETLDPRFKGERSNAFYWSHHLRYLIADYSDQIAVWCHGHTHHSQDTMVDGVRVVCNPRGYPGECPDWKPLTIEIEK